MKQSKNAKPYATTTSTNRHGGVRRYAAPPETSRDDGDRDPAFPSATRASRPTTGRPVAAASDAFSVVVVDEMGGPRREPFVSPAGAELPPEVAAMGAGREDDYRANPVNPPERPAPAANLKGR